MERVSWHIYLFELHLFRIQPDENTDENIKDSPDAIT